MLVRLWSSTNKFGREVVDRVRVDQANALREDKPARRVIKRSRSLFQTLNGPEIGR